MIRTDSDTPCRAWSWRGHNVDHATRKDPVDLFIQQHTAQVSVRSIGTSVQVVCMRTWVHLDELCRSDDGGVSTQELPLTPSSPCWPSSNFAGKSTQLKFEVCCMTWIWLQLSYDMKLRVWVELTRNLGLLLIMRFSLTELKAWFSFRRICRSYDAPLGFPSLLLPSAPACSSFCRIPMNRPHCCSSSSWRPTNPNPIRASQTRKIYQPVAVGP